MNTATLRAVMDAAEYKRERDRLQELYGDPDDRPETVTAKRDQAFADLFYRSGWTQDQLAEVEGKTQPWVTYRLRFGRFLDYATNITGVINDTLTEGKFRGYWNRTDKNKDDEHARFAAVVRLMHEPPVLSPKPRHTAPKTDKAREVVRPLVEAGKPIDRVALAEEHDLTVRAVSDARKIELGRMEGLQEAAENTIDPSILSQSAQEKFATLDRRLRAKYEAEFSDRVSREIRRHINEYVLPHYKEKLAQAEMLMKTGKPLTNAEFISLLRALHPDSTSTELRHAAFVLLKEKQIVLRPEDRDHPLTSGLPTSLAELMAMKAERKRKKGQQFAPNLIH